jgi:predicted nicotinamide N-methyase
MPVAARASLATRCDATSFDDGRTRRGAPVRRRRRRTPFGGRRRRGGAMSTVAALARDRTPIDKIFSLVTEDVVVDRERQVTVKVVRPKDEDEVVEYYVERMMLDSDPYWAVLWPSARAVSRYIARAPALVRDKAVCDLGAGLGLAGLAACACGAKKVALYDRERLAMECALLSIEANGFGDRVYVEEFDWNVIRTDQEKFDTLLACDVLYEEAAVGPVAELVPRLVKQGGGRFLLGDPPLRAPQNRAKFKSILCDQYGAFLMRELSVTEATTDGGDDDELVFIDFKL